MDEVEEYENSQLEAEANEGTADVSRVLFLRQLPAQATENDLREFGKEFGDIVNVYKVPGKHQGFIEFSNIDQSAKCYLYYQTHQAVLRGRNIEVKYSPRDCITRPAQRDISAVLLVTISLPIHPVDCDTLYQIFSSYNGQVCRLILFDKHSQIHALVEFSNPQQAYIAKMALDGHNIYQDGCVMKIQYSRLQSLNVTDNHKNARDYTVGNPPPATLNLQYHGSFSPSATRPATGQQQQQSVVHVSNLNDSAISPDVLFNLFGTAGDVMRVKILYKNRSQALIQLKDFEHSQSVIRHLHGLPFMGRPLKISQSKLLEIQLPVTREDDDQHQIDAAALTSNFQDFSTLHRFSSEPAGINTYSVIPPSKFLHFGRVENMELDAINGSILVSMDSVDSAAQALSIHHGFVLPGDNEVEGSPVYISFSRRQL